MLREVKKFAHGHSANAKAGVALRPLDLKIAVPSTVVYL